ncbi:ComEC/Rec2 family competence protein [Halopiger xanaduensis]|uniref:Beta-lactamase domain protein n=1 Tax=Halopiger xanaduensis (strain DSM 18323 / JCM 14033 / SH-6) TaxID=797210 RepID=F8DAT8_HALXS|nr:MBL fold metallo-hydrolase [Halopiger xanaduensis]AEH37033.1 beta-lactamase domain protein [Halopiger xanaduensis SH-6]
MQRSALVVAVGLTVVLAGCAGGVDLGTSTDSSTDAASVDAAGDLEIHHIDVGQADSTLIVTPANETILIDTGDWRDDGQTVIDYLEAQDIERIDHLVATHGHADHIGGHPAVIEHFEENGEGVGAAYDSGVAHTSATYENYLDAIEEHDVDLFQVVAGDRLPLESASADGSNATLEATVLNPPEERHSDGVDENSVVLSLAYGEFTYLTTGDIERTTERRLIDAHGDTLAADAYQAGHHGSSTSSSDPFMDAVDPEVTVISSALDSQYGHPHDEVLESLAERGIETYWTGVHGDTVITVDGGDDVSVTTERDGPTDAAELLERKHDENDDSAANSVGLSISPGPASPAIDVVPARTVG